jgi:hypothetical protein
VAASPELVRRQTMSDDAFEAVFQHRRQLRSIARFAAQQRVRRVAIADVSKNLYATYQACQCAGLEVTAIVDDRPAFTGLSYRHVPIVSRRDVAKAGVDGVVLSNINPAQTDAAHEALLDAIDRPIHRLWMPRTLSIDTQSRIAA